jgi:hypothetical protein
MAGCVLDRCGDQFAMFAESTVGDSPSGADDCQSLGSFANRKSIKDGRGKVKSPSGVMGATVQRDYL